MRRISVLVLVMSVVILAMAASVAVAASPHFTKGGIPKCTIGGTTSDSSRDVACTGELAGLGGGDLSVLTTAQGSATYLCINPGGNDAPGQNKVPGTSSGTPTITPGDQIKNGRAPVTDATTLTAPQSVSAEQAGCPNPQWTAEFQSLVVTGVTFQVSQGGDVIVTCNRTGSNLDDFTFTKAQCTFA